MAVIAVIVARAGSKRLPGKALLPFAGTSLVGHKARVLRECPVIDRVIVASDSPEILAAGAEFGAEAMVRDALHCDEERCSANGMIADVAWKIEADPDDLILWAHPTNPLVRAPTYEAAVGAYLAHRPLFDSLCSVFPMRRHAWQRPRDGVGATPLNFMPFAARHQAAGELGAIDFQCGSIFIQPLWQMRNNRYFYGAWPFLFEMAGREWWGVDTREDYEIALSIMGRSRSLD